MKSNKDVEGNIVSGKCEFRTKTIILPVPIPSLSLPMLPGIVDEKIASVCPDRDKSTNRCNIIAGGGIYPCQFN